MIRVCILILFFASTLCFATGEKANTDDDQKDSNKIIVIDGKLQFRVRNSPSIDFESVSPLDNTLIRKLIDGIEKLTPEEYPQSIGEYRKHIETYIEQKKRVCSGEFSTIILASEGSSMSEHVQQDAKLSKDDSKMCFKQLQGLQVHYINNLYNIRKKYVEFIHQQRLSELARSKKESIDNINRAFEKKKF